MTVNWGQIFNFILLGKNKNIFNTSWREEHVCAIKNRHSLAQKLAAKNCSCRKCYLFSSDLTWVLNRAEETVGDHSPGPENVYSCRRLEGPDMFRKRAPFEKIVGQIRWLFRFWRGSPLAPKSSAPWKSETYFVCFLLNWALFEKIVGKIRWIFSFWRGHFGPLKVLVPSPLPPHLNSFLQSCSGRVLIWPEEVKLDIVRLGTSWKIVWPLSRTSVSIGGKVVLGVAPPTCVLWWGK